MDETTIINMPTGGKMKTQMIMLPNGNYEERVCFIQHQCLKGFIECVEYSYEKPKLILKIHDGDPYEDGYSNEIEVNYCPMCGYRPERLSGEDPVKRICDSPTQTTKGLEIGRNDRFTS